MPKSSEPASRGFEVVRECPRFPALLRRGRKFDFVGRAKKSVEIRAKIRRIAESGLPALILGESGCGKSHFARLIHALSPRRNSVFFDENISSLSEGLAESELFGSVEGAFTDSRNRTGYFSMADGGTLFLDEIGEASPSLQKKLLTVIETGTFRRVGSSRREEADVRLIFATNADLRGKIARGEFREDLYYRIANLVVHVPPLRDVKDDIPAFCEKYLEQGGCRKRFTPFAMEMLCDFDWPGNVRQLQNTIDRAVFNCDEGDLIGPEHIEIY